MRALLLLSAAAAAAAAAPRDAAVARCLERGGASCAPSAEDEAKKLNELRDERKKKADEQPTVEAADADPMPSVGRGAADLPPAPRFRLPPKGYAVSYGRLIRVGAPTPHPADRGATAARHDAAVAAEATPRAPPSARVRERAAAVRLAQSVTPGLAKAPPWWDRPPVWMRDTPWWLRRFAEPNHRPAFVEGGPPAKAKTGDLEREGGGGGGGGGAAADPIPRFTAGAGTPVAPAPAPARRAAERHERRRATAVVPMLPPAPLLDERPP